MFFFRCFVIITWFLFFCSQELFPSVYLKDNLQQAKLGDYVVISQNKIFIFLRIVNKNDKCITIEEVVVSKNFKINRNHSWQNWIEAGLNNSNSHVLYKIIK